jgi:hypothetical protein
MDMGENMLSGSWVLSSVLTIHAEILAEAGEEMFQYSLKAVSAKTGLLEQIAGGAPKGKVWYSAKPADEPILEHFASALDKVNPNQLYGYIQAVDDSLKAVRLQLSTFRELLPGSPIVSDESSKEVILNAKATLLRARATQLGAYVCKILGKQSSDERKRLGKYAAEFAQDTKSCFSLRCHPELNEKCAAEGVGGVNKKGGAPPTNSAVA